MRIGFECRVGLRVRSSTRNTMDTKVARDACQGTILYVKGRFSMCGSEVSMLNSFPHSKGSATSLTSDTFSPQGNIPVRVGVHH